MKNYAFLNAFVLFFVLFLSGCNDATKQELEQSIQKETMGVVATEREEKEIPKPYTNAVIAINDKDWDLANTYLDLVISDFPDSEYVLPAQILKGTIQLSRMEAFNDLVDILANGIERGSSLLDLDDLETLSSYVDEIKDGYKKNQTEQGVTTESILRTYKTDNDYSKYYKDLKASYPGGFNNNLSFFESVGYPVPTESEINEYLDANYDATVTEYIEELIQEPERLNYNYLRLFHNIGGSMYDDNPELAKEFFNIVLDLTSDDPYNEVRVRIEKVWNYSNAVEN